MKKYQNTLLAGVAVLAFLAGPGLASAQESKEHMGGSQAASPQAGQSMNKRTQPQAQETGKGTQTQAQEKGKISTDRTAQTGKENLSPRSQETQKMGQRGVRAEHMNRGSEHGRQNTAEQQRTLKGLKGDTTKPMQGENQEGSTSNTRGNTSNQAQQRTPQNNIQRGTENNRGSARVNGGGTEAHGGRTEVEGGNVRLSEPQRTQIKETVINGRNAPRVGHVDFDVRVGTLIPRSKIHVIRVPETLVRIEPRWHGFLYFVYEDEVVIVNPRSMRIVAVLPV